MQPKGDRLKTTTLTLGLAVGIAAGLMAAATAYSAAAPYMKDGLWEMAVKVEMPGMPGNMPTNTVQRCMSAKDFQDPRKTTPDTSGGSTQCGVSNYRVQGNTATWEMACKGKEQMKGTGTMTFEGERYTGVNRMTMSQDGQSTKMTMNYAGRYLGPCKPAQK
jgi:hypothetical protein